MEVKHFLLKFNHGVEIGAALAYAGHYYRTKDDEVALIYLDELDHQYELERILNQFEQKPSPIIDGAFKLVGTMIKKLCKVCPIWSLNYVARSLEVFAVFNYSYLAAIYPGFQSKLLEMAKTEQKHSEYFTR